MNFLVFWLLSVFLIQIPRCTSINIIKISGSGVFNIHPCMDALLQTYSEWRNRNLEEIGSDNRIETEFEVEKTDNVSASAFENLIKHDELDFATIFGQTQSSVLADYPSLLTFPIFAEPFVVVYRVLQNGATNNKLVPSLSLTKSQFVGIFQATIKNWDEDEMVTAGIALPEMPITVWLHKPKKPSSIHLIRQLVEKYGGPAADQDEPIWEEIPNFNLVTSSYAALGGVAITNGAIGLTRYVEFKKNFGDGTLFNAASITNFNGDFVNPVGQQDSPNLNESIAKTKFSSDFQAEILFPDGGSYPLGAFTFVIVRRRAVPPAQLDCDTQTELLRFIRWMSRNPDEESDPNSRNDDDEDENENESSNKDGPGIIRKNYFTVLPKQTLETIQDVALKKMRCGPNNSVSVFDQFKLESAKEKNSPHLGLTIGLPVALVLVGLLIFHCLSGVSKRMIFIRRAQQQIYNVTKNRIKIIKASKEKYECMMQVRKYMEGRGSKPVFVVGEYDEDGEDVVMLRRIDILVTHIEFPLRIHLVQLMQEIRHPNVVRFYGLTELRDFHSKCFVISQFCPLGDLRTALNNKRHELDSPIKFGMMKGITEGLLYLHWKGIIHGNLRSTAVYLEADWTTKISDWDLTGIEILADKFKNRERIWQKDLNVEEESIYLPPLLWSAPEILTAVARNEVYRPTFACDVFSFSIIFFEILTRDLPYEYNLVPHSMTFDQLFAMIRREVNPLRPLDFKEREQVAMMIPQSIVHIMETGWAADPTIRPTIAKVREVLMAVNSKMKRLADLTIVHTRAQIEQYKRNIIKNYEETLELTNELEKTKIDFLTRWVYEANLAGETIEPKFYQMVYVLRCVLVNYDGLCGVTHGDAVLYFVDRFYRLIDKILPPDHNIHRLHSNGDEITVVGAIPSGGVEYASKIATLAFDVLVAIWNADLLDIDWERMEVRIGMSCGPVVAGIYGNVHRSFTLVGSSDEAVVVENAGATYRILITEAFYEALKVYPNFTCQPNLDEKHSISDNQKTFWLVRKEHYQHQSVLDKIAVGYPPPDQLGLIFEGEETLRRIRDRRNRQVVKASLPVQHAGSYIEKDLRSGYLIEHRNRTKETSSILSLTRDKDEQHHRGRHHHHTKDHHQILPSKSHIFGSMLGPQGFSSLKVHYVKHKHKQKTHHESQQLKQVQRLFAGQIGAIGNIEKTGNVEKTEKFFADSTENVKNRSEDVVPTVEQRIALYEKTAAHEESEIHHRLRRKVRRKKKQTQIPKEVGEKLSSHSVMIKTRISNLPDITDEHVEQEPLLTVNDDVEIRQRTRKKKENDRDQSKSKSKSRSRHRLGVQKTKDVKESMNENPDVEDLFRQGRQLHLKSKSRKKRRRRDETVSISDSLVDPNEEENEDLVDVI